MRYFMLQFNNEPLAITQLELGYLTLEEMIAFAALPEEALLEQGPAKLVKDDKINDKVKFRSTINAALEAYLAKLQVAKVRIIREPGDETYMILARTIAEQQREKKILLQNEFVTDAHKT